MNIKKFITFIKSIHLKSSLKIFNIIFFIASLVTIGLFGWFPFFMFIMPFSVMHMIYCKSMNFISTLPGFVIIEMLYLQLIDQFPVLETFIQYINPYYLSC